MGHAGPATRPRDRGGYQGKTREEGRQGVGDLGEGWEDVGEGMGEREGEGGGAEGVGTKGKGMGGEKGMGRDGEEDIGRGGENGVGGGGEMEKEENPWIKRGGQNPGADWQPDAWTPRMPGKRDR